MGKKLLKIPNEMKNIVNTCIILRGQKVSKCLESQCLYHKRQMEAKNGVNKRGHSVKFDADICSRICVAFHQYHCPGHHFWTSKKKLIHEQN